MSNIKKVVILGQFGVGKTSLTRRFIDNSFSEDYLVTLGVQIKKKVLKNDSGEPISLIIWDVEGTTSVSKTRPSYMLGAHAIIYVFDSARVETYQNLKEELSFLKSYNVPVKVLANKSDLGHIKSVLSFLQDNDITIDYFTSAKSGENVEKTFQELANQLSS